jgi:putative FmdB family regulatory protein
MPVEARPAEGAGPALRSRFADGGNPGRRPQAAGNPLQFKVFPKLPPTLDGPFADMPIYAYRCAACGFEKDVLQKISDAPLTDCPECGKAEFAKRLTAPAFQLKGSGWYVTDFRDNGKGGAKDGKSGESASKSDGGESKSAGGDAAAAKPAGDSASSGSGSTSASPAPAPSTGGEKSA